MWEGEESCYLVNISIDTRPKCISPILHRVPGKTCYNIGYIGYYFQLSFMHFLFILFSKPKLYSGWQSSVESNFAFYLFSFELLRSVIAPISQRICERFFFWRHCVDLRLLWFARLLLWFWFYKQLKTALMALILPLIF